MNFGSSPDFQIPILSQVVGFIADIMRIGLEFFYDLFSRFGFPNYVLAIIALTIVIKTLLLPLAIKQIRSMKAMQELQPEIQKIQKRFRTDPQRLREEMAKLYRDHGASPLAGCLPLLVQMPFLIAMYYAILGFNYDPSHMDFLWIESLAVEDNTYILPLLSAATTFLVSWQTTPKNAPSNQKTMLLLMPIMIGWMSMQFPSGLVIYWVINNVYQYVQQLIMFHGERGGASAQAVVATKKSNRKKTEKAEDGEDAPVKRKKIIRKKIIKKVVKKSAPVGDNQSENDDVKDKNHDINSESGKAGE